MPAVERQRLEVMFIQEKVLEIGKRRWGDWNRAREGVIPVLIPTQALMSQKGNRRPVPPRWGHPHSLVLVGCSEPRGRPRGAPEWEGSGREAPGKRGLGHGQPRVDAGHGIGVRSDAPRGGGCPSVSPGGAAGSSAPLIGLESCSKELFTCNRHP